MSDHKCKLCGKEFVSGVALGGHWRYHTPFENLTKDGSRKDRLLNERGRKCQICELTEWRGKPIPIELDHIDGNSQNNSKENLRLICPNCHAQTDSYRGKNKGKAVDPARRARYKKYRSLPD